MFFLSSPLPCLSCLPSSLFRRKNLGNQTVALTDRHTCRRTPRNTDPITLGDPGRLVGRLEETGGDWPFIHTVFVLCRLVRCGRYRQEKRECCQADAVSRLPPSQHTVFLPLHSTLHTIQTTLHYTTLNYTPYNSTTLYKITLNYTTIQYNTLHYTLHCTHRAVK